MNFNERIEKAGLLLNDTEDDIVEYIRSHKDDIKNVSIRKMAEELFIAPNAIMRFSKKLGYSGFAEMKFALQNEASDTELSFTKELVSMLPNNVMKTLDVIDDEQFKETVNVIHKASRCIFAGVGDSAYFCELLGKNMRCLDYDVQYFHDIHDMIYAVNHGRKDDIAIIICARGENERLVKIAETAVQREMKVISITHFYQNPLAEKAHYNLYFWGEYRSFQNYNVTDRTGRMLLIRLLSEALWRSYD